MAVTLAIKPDCAAEPDSQGRVLCILVLSCDGRTLGKRYPKQWIPPDKAGAYKCPEDLPTRSLRRIGTQMVHSYAPSP